MGDEALVDGEDALRSDRLSETVEDAAVEVAVLVVQTGHDCVLRGYIC